MKKNLFIAFEGIDGCGKTTQVSLLAKNLTQAGIPVLTTAEPTKGPIGAMIRKIFRHEMEADQRTIAALFVADRLEHILNKKDGLLKTLASGTTVICDRYYFSSYAYHSVHVPMDWVIRANALSADLLRPDLNIFIDISPELSMERLRLGREHVEMYETLDNLTIVRKRYREAFEKLKSKEKVLRIDGSLPIEEISNLIWKEVLKNLVPKRTVS